MSITFRCPDCGVRLEAGEGAGGELVKCGRCREWVRVPDDGPPPRSDGGDRAWSLAVGFQVVGAVLFFVGLASFLAGPARPGVEAAGLGGHQPRAALR